MLIKGLMLLQLVRPGCAWLYIFSNTETGNSRKPGIHPADVKENEKCRGAAATFVVKHFST